MLAGETSLQLLTLKLLYLIFTTPSTQEYFYTNDLRVLVDILIRNLLDLPADASALRHTYLRVLYPLLAHSQLKNPPHYKREEIRELLAVLAGAQQIHEKGDDDVSGRLWGHFEEADETTKRLVTRCRTVIWLTEPETTVSDIEAAVDDGTPTSPVDAISGERVPPVPPVPRKLRKRNVAKRVTGYLALQHESARESALSVLEVAAQRERPGVITPSRKASLQDAASKKEKPLPPKTRRSTWSRKAREVGPSPREYNAGDRATLTTAEEPTQDSLEVGAATSATSGGLDHPPSAKQPPPTPKARRWHGLRRKKEDEGSGATRYDDVTEGSAFPTMPPEKTLSVYEAGSLKASVAEALSDVQAEATDTINQALERVTMSPLSKSEVKTVLAPPSPAPPRGVPGPTFSLERSPFIGDDEDD